MVLRSGRHILPIFLVLCVSDLVLGNEFKFEYYIAPDAIRLRFDYGSHQIVSIKYDHFTKYQSIQNYKQDYHGFMRIPNLVPCTLYEFFAIVENEYSAFGHRENILMISSGLVLRTEPYEDTILVLMNYAYEACIPNLVVMINNSIVILYPHDNLYRWSVIKYLSPCTNYNLAISIKINSEFYNIYDETVTTKSIQFREVESINYDNATTTLRWPNFLKVCPMKYLIIITLDSNQTGIDPIIHKSVMNEYKLDFLAGCSTYNITVTSENDRDFSMNISIEQGFKDPGPITNLNAELVNTTLLVNWSPPTKNPACIDHYNVKIDKIHSDTKAHEHTLLDYNPSKIYNITVCQVPLVLEMCLNYKFGIQNVSNIDINTNSINRLTTITWNVSDYEKHHIKYYEARLFDESGELMSHKCESAMIRFPDLVSCKTYRLEIETFPNQKWPSKIMSIFELKTEPKVPDTPLPPELISRSSNSLTMQTKYVNLNDKCKIEMFQIVCKDYVHIRRYAYDEEGRVTINNLKTKTKYYCTALARNGLGWSNSSKTRDFYVNRLTRYDHVQMYVNSLSSNSMEVSWISDLGGKWFLNITKAESNDEILMRCDILKYNFSTTVDYNPPYKIVNLDPGTNYAISLDGAITVNNNYNSQIFVTTDPDVPFQVTHLNISHLTGRSVTITWQLPCKINGRIKIFVGQVVEIDPHSLIKTVYDWTIPYYSTLEAIEIFNYTEKRIKPEHNYSISVAIKLVNFAGPLNESKIEFLSPADSSQNENSSAKPNTNMEIIVVLVLCLALILILASIGWYYKFKKTKSLPPNSTYIEVEYFSDFYKFLSKDFYAGEYQSINDMDLSHLDQTISKNQPGKNRYTDITPYDYNRVVLTPNEFCSTDYINASYIDGCKHKRQYIATQGPIEQTVYDFWHMVVEQKCNKIVMLAQLREDGVTKCFKYFPHEDEILQFNDLEIANVDEMNFGNFMRRGLVISKGEAKRLIAHYQFIVWPDRDCPANKLDLIEFVEFTRDIDKKSMNPTVVHCSAGVGRTGTFIALNLLFQSFQAEKYISIFETVRKLRRQRCRMVQNVDQYEFLYASVNMYYFKRVYKGKDVNN